MNVEAGKMCLNKDNGMKRRKENHGGEFRYGAYNIYLLIRC